MSGALDGFRVLEFGGYTAAQVLGMLLADQGAEVIKVEPPDGERLRGSVPFAVWNRGKKSVVVDAAAADYAAIIRRLAAAADVLITDFDATAAGIPIQRLMDANPRLVCVSLPAFGASHPHADAPPLEPLVAAATGVYIDRGGGGPSLIAVPHAGIFGAITAAPAVAAALLYREAAGEGQHISVPLYDAMFGAMGAHLVRLPGETSPYVQQSHPVIARFYECSDGRWLNINAGYPRALKPMVEAFGYPEWAAPLLDVESLRAHPEDRQLWIDRIARVWKRRPALEWERIMDEAGVPCTMCRTIEEWIECDQAAAMGAVIEVDDPVYGRMRQVGVQAHMSETEGGVWRHAPALGEHTRDILRAL